MRIFSLTNNKRRTNGIYAEGRQATNSKVGRNYWFRVCLDFPCPAVHSAARKVTDLRLFCCAIEYLRCSTMVDVRNLGTSALLTSTLFAFKQTVCSVYVCYRKSCICDICNVRSRNLYYLCYIRKFLKFRDITITIDFDDF